MYCYNLYLLLVEVSTTLQNSRGLSHEELSIKKCFPKKEFPLCRIVLAFLSAAPENVSEIWGNIVPRYNNNNNNNNNCLFVMKL